MGGLDRRLKGQQRPDSFFFFPKDLFILEKE